LDRVIDRVVLNQRDKATPDDVAKVAVQVHQKHLDAFNQAMGFFSQHPLLVKVLGMLAIVK